MSNRDRYGERRLMAGRLDGRGDAGRNGGFFESKNAGGQLMRYFVGERGKCLKNGVMYEEKCRRCELLVVQLFQI